MESNCIKQPASSWPRTSRWQSWEHLDEVTIVVERL